MKLYWVIVSSVEVTSREPKSKYNSIPLDLYPTSIEWHIYVFWLNRRIFRSFLNDSDIRLEYFVFLYFFGANKLLNVLNLCKIGWIWVLSISETNLKPSLNFRSENYIYTTMPDKKRHPLPVYVKNSSLYTEFLEWKRVPIDH